MRGSSIITRCLGLLGVLASLVVLMVAIFAGNASAAVYQQTGSFTANPRGMDIDQSTGNLYLVDGGNEIKVFDASGNGLSPIGSSESGAYTAVAVDNSTDPLAGTIYVYTNKPFSEGIEGFDALGNAAGAPFSLNTAGGLAKLAIGTDGDIHVGYPEGLDSKPAWIHKLGIYDSSATLQQTLECSDCPAPSRFGLLNGVGLDSTGRIYTASPETTFDEIQAVKVSATGGTYKLSIGGESTGATGTGNITSGSAIIQNVITSSGAFVSEEEISGPGIPPGTRIASFSKLFKRITLNAPATETLTGASISADMSYDGSSDMVSGALSALSGINVINVEAQPGGVHKVNFDSPGVDLEQMTADNSKLIGGEATVETLSDGGLDPARAIQFDSNGENPTIFTSGDVQGLAVDQATDKIFVAKSDGEGGGWHVVGYDSAGNEFADFGLGTIGGSESPSTATTLAINSTTGDIYVGDRANEKVWIYSPILPNVTTTAASAETQTTATLNGTVNPNSGGAIEDCHFEWGTNTEYEGGTVPCASNPPDGNSAVPVEGALSGLSANTTYHYRLVASNDSNMPARGADQTFKTDPNAPSVTTGAAASITNVSAQLTGSVTPNGGATTCAFEYGTSAAYGSETPCTANPGAGSSPVAVGASLSALAPNTTYHYRLKASNSGGETKGAVDKTFTTLPNPPSVTTEAATGISQSGATLNAKVNANGDPADCFFEYGASNSYGSTVSCSIAPVAGDASTAVSASLSGLSAATTYHYRVVAENGGGKGSGVDMTFTTNAAPALPTPPVTLPLPPPTSDDGAAKQACIAKAMKAFKKAKKAAVKKKGKAKAKAMQAANRRKAKAIKGCNALLG
jgi:hypothetical protein